MTHLLAAQRERLVREHRLDDGSKLNDDDLMPYRVESIGRVPPRTKEELADVGVHKRKSGYIVEIKLDILPEPVQVGISRVGLYQLRLELPNTYGAGFFDATICVPSHVDPKDAITKEGYTWYRVDCPCVTRCIHHVPSFALGVASTEREHMRNNDTGSYADTFERRHKRLSRKDHCDDDRCPLKYKKSAANGSPSLSSKGTCTGYLVWDTTEGVPAYTHNCPHAMGHRIVRAIMDTYVDDHVAAVMLNQRATLVERGKGGIDTYKRKMDRARPDMSKARRVCEEEEQHIDRAIHESLEYSSNYANHHGDPKSSQFSEDDIALRQAINASLADQMVVGVTTTDQ